MKAYTRQPMVVALVGMVALAQWGCALKRIGGPSLEEVRKQVGVIGVAAPSGARSADLKGPTSGKGLAAAKGAGAGALAGATPGGAILKGVAHCGGGREIGAIVCGTIAVFGLGVAVAGATLGALAGGLHGAANAEAPSKEIGEALKSTVAELNPQEALRASVLQAGPRQTSLTFVPVEPAHAGDPEWGHAGSAADTTLEVALKTVRLTREGPGANPPVALVATARARLVRAADGRELYRHAVRHQSATRLYEEWAADSGQHLKQALATASAQMAEEIIDVVFVRSNPPTVTPTPERSQPAVVTSSVQNPPSELTRSWSPAQSRAEAAKQDWCRRRHFEGRANWRDRLPDYRICLAR